MDLKHSFEKGNLKHTIDLFNDLFKQGKLKPLNERENLKCLYYAITSLKSLQNFSNYKKYLFTSQIPKMSEVKDDKVSLVIWYIIQFQLTNFNEEESAKIFKLFKKADDLIDSFTLEEQLENFEWISYLISSKGSCYYTIGMNNLTKPFVNPDKALEYYKKSLSLQEKADFKFGMTINLNLMGIISEAKGEIQKAIEYTKRSLDIARTLQANERIMVALANLSYYNIKIGNINQAIIYIKKSIKLNESIGKIGHFSLFLGLIYAQKLETKSAMKYFQIAYDDFKKGDFEFGMVNSLHALGNLYLQIGETLKAKDGYQRILTLNPDDTIECRYEILFRLIEISLDENNRELAIKYKHELDNFHKIKSKRNRDFYQQMSEALLGKTSTRFKLKVEAQELYENLLEGGIEDYSKKALVLSNLIEMLLEEYLVYNDKDVLRELEEKISTLYTLGLVNSNFALLFTSLLLKVKLLILENKFDEVSDVFEQALTLAEEKKLPKLKEKIILEMEKEASLKNDISDTLNRRIENLKMKSYIVEAKKIMSYDIDKFSQ